MEIEYSVAQYQVQQCTYQSTNHAQQLRDASRIIESELHTFPQQK